MFVRERVRKSDSGGHPLGLVTGLPSGGKASVQTDFAERRGRPQENKAALVPLLSCDNPVNN